MNPLLEAIQNRDLEAGRQALLGQEQVAEGRTEQGVSALMLALYYEMPELASAIRQQLNSIDFFEAAATGELAQVQAAVGADPSLVDAHSADGFTVLGLACFFRQDAVAHYLMDSGADLNRAATNANKVAPIHAVCARQNLLLLQELLARGADPNLEQQGGFTPLDTALGCKNQEMERLLLAAGARPKS